MPLRKPNGCRLHAQQAQAEKVTELQQQLKQAQAEGKKALVQSRSRLLALHDQCRQQQDQLTMLHEQLRHGEHAKQDAILATEQQLKKAQENAPALLSVTQQLRQVQQQLTEAQLRADSQQAESARQSDSKGKILEKLRRQQTSASNVEQALKHEVSQLKQQLGERAEAAQDAGRSMAQLQNSLDSAISEA